MTQFQELIEKWADPSDAQKHLELSHFLQSPPPPISDPFRPAYVRNNLVYQDWISLFKSQLACMLISKRSDLLTLEASWREDFREEKIRSVEERNVALYGNPRYRTQKDEIDEIQLIIDRLSTLEWILRSAAK